jgi:sporulation protein YunB
MKRRRQYTIRILFFLLLLCLILTIVACYQLRPLTEALTVARVDNAISQIINRAISEEIDSGEIDYDRIISLEKDMDGNITALKTNMAEVNRLKARILTLLDEEISDISIEDISIPLGSLLAPDLFYGRGPTLPVRIISCSTTSAEFHNLFSEAGINQTLHQIAMDVSVTISVMLPTGSLDVDVTSEVIVAETVIVGSVPNQYVNFDGTPAESSVAEDYFTYAE